MPLSKSFKDQNQRSAMG